MSYATVRYAEEKYAGDAAGPPPPAPADASVVPHGAENIDGSNSPRTLTAWQGVIVQSDGTNWFIL